MTKQLISFLYLLLFLGSAYAQTMFETTHGEPSRNELLEAIIQTNDGGYAMLGYTASYGNGSYDMYMVKTDDLGNQQWYAVFGSDEDDRGAALQQTPDGGYILAGKTGSHLNHDVYLLKTNAQGTQEWATTIGSPFADESVSEILLAPDGGYIIAGGNPHVWLVKTDATGFVEWEQNYPDAYLAAQSLQATPDGGYLLCGTATDNVGGTVLMMIKTYPDGTTQWIQKIADAPNSFFTNLVIGKYAIPLADGGYLGIGFTHTDGYFKIIAHKTLESGNPVWTKVYNLNPALSANYGAVQAIPNHLLQLPNGAFMLAGCYSNVAGNQAFSWQLNEQGDWLQEQTYTFGIMPVSNISCMAINSAGNICHTGFTAGFTAPGFDALLFETTPAGNMQWVKTYGEPDNLNNEWGYALALSPTDNTLMLTGQTNSYAANGLEDVLFCKANASTGNMVWQKYYDYQGNTEVGWGIAPAQDGGWVIAGFTADSNSKNDIYLLKTDANGNKLWDITLGIAASNRAWSINSTPDGGYILVGSVLDTLGASSLVYVAKLQADGNITWSNLYGYLSAIAYRIRPTADGGYIFAGRTRNPAFGSDNKAYIVKLHNNGQIAWEYFGGSGSQWSRMFDVVETNTGAFMGVGTILHPDSMQYKMYLLNLTAGGGLAWEKTINVPGNNFGNYKALQTYEGTFAFLGNVELSADPLNRQGFLLRTNLYGNTQWSKLYGNNVGIGTVLYDAIQNPDGGFTLFGGIQTKGTTNDLYLLKTDAFGNVPNSIATTHFVPDSPHTAANSLHIYPNPATGGNFTIEAPNLTTSGEPCRLSIFNVSGKLVFERSIASQQLQTSLPLHLPQLQQGVYLIQLQNQHQLWQGKLITTH